MDLLLKPPSTLDTGEQLDISIEIKWNFLIHVAPFPLTLLLNKKLLMLPFLQSVKDKFDSLTKPGNNVVKLTDSLSTLQSLERGKYENKEMSRIAENLIISKNIMA